MNLFVCNGGNLLPPQCMLHKTRRRRHDSKTKVVGIAASRPYCVLIILGMSDEDVHFVVVNMLGDFTKIGVRIVG